MEPADVRSGHILVDLDREHQRDVDVDAVGDALLDGGQALFGRRDLDENIGPPNPVKEVVRHRDGALRIVSHPGENLDADVTVFVFRLLVDGLEHVGGGLDVFDDQAEHDLFVGLAVIDQFAQGIVVVAAAADRLLEDGGVGGHADDSVLLDHSLQFSGGHQTAPDVIQPDAGAGLVEFKQGVLGHR